MVKLENADRERKDNSEDEVEEKLEDHEYAFHDFDIDDDGFLSVSEVWISFSSIIGSIRHYVNRTFAQWGSRGNTARLIMGYWIPKILSSAGSIPIISPRFPQSFFFLLLWSLGTLFHSIPFPSLALSPSSYSSALLSPINYLFEHGWCYFHMRILPQLLQFHLPLLLLYSPLFSTAKLVLPFPPNFYSGAFKPPWLIPSLSLSLFLTIAKVNRAILSTYDTRTTDGDCLEM